VIFVSRAKDSSGHDHVGKGHKEGGQFAKGSGGKAAETHGHHISPEQKRQMLKKHQNRRDERRNLREKQRKEGKGFSERIKEHKQLRDKHREDRLKSSQGVRRYAKERAAESRGEKREHSPSEKAKLDRLKKGKPTDYKSNKARTAAESAGMTDTAVQIFTKANEFVLADLLGGKADPDCKPVDIEIRIGNKTHGIEVKTLTYGKNDKITMHAKPKPYEKESAIDRKIAWQKEHKTTVHALVNDHRDTFKGGESKELYSGNRYYYKRGTGSFRISAMHPVNSIEELNSLIAMPYDQLPKKAQGPRRGGLT
jgi:hypothetical protein